MRRITPLIGLLVVACAAEGGTWPSLARRPGEAAPMVPRPVAGGAAVASVAAPTSPEPAPTVPPVAIDDIGARLNTIGRDIDDIAARLRTQRTALETAMRQPRSAAAGSEANGSVELETTRLERIGNQIADVRDRLDAIAGTLADATASGVDANSQIKTAGGLIARTRALDANYQAALAAAGAGRPG